jgi:aspartate aminotransferase-like enzyme
MTPTGIAFASASERTWRRLVAEVADRYGVQLVMGNGKLAERVVRIGHCGHVDGFDVLAAVELWLRSSGFAVPPGVDSPSCTARCSGCPRAPPLSAR